MGSPRKLMKPAGEVAREYVEAQLTVMRKHGSAPTLTADKRASLEARIARTITQLRGRYQKEV